MRYVLKRTIPALAWAAAAAATCAAETVEHPFILWTRAEAGQIRARITAEPWAREKFSERFQKATNAWGRSTIDNLFFYTMTGDRDSYEAEKKPLLGFVNAPPLVKDMTDWRWHHVDHSDMAVRYDVFYDELTPAQRRAIEETFRRLAVFGIEEEPLRGFENVRMVSHMFSALATGDKRLIRAIFDCKGGGREYFAGIREGLFTAQGNNPSPRTAGQIWTWCRAVERLGMNEIGFDCKGPGGETLRNLLQGIAALGDPVILIPGGMPYYGRSALALDFSPGSFHRIPMEGFPDEVFRAPIVIGRLRDGRGGWGDWLNTVAHKNYDVYENGTFRMQLGLVFELAHQRWPDADFGYFLHAMRDPGAAVYHPSIYWGLDPVAAPAGAPPAVTSAVYRSVGAALLRAEEGPGYWTSPAPFAVLRLPRASRGTGGSAFSLLSLHAFNRPLYRSHRIGGNFPPHWYLSGKAHSTVVIDNASTGLPDAPAVRRHFDANVKFAALRSRSRTWTETDAQGAPVVRHAALHPGVETERALMLTREYLFDVFRLESGQPHVYDWMVQALGSARPDAPERWRPTEDLNATLPDTTDRMPFNYDEQHAFDPAGETWSLSAVQTAPADDPAATVMGPDWYGRGIGVRVTLLGEAGTRAFHARRPLRRALTREEKARAELEKYPLRAQERTGEYDRVDREITELAILPPDAATVKPGAAPTTPQKPEPFNPVGVVAEKHPETGGVTIIAERRAARTVFVALHEPFENERWRIPEFTRIEQTDRAVGVLARGANGSPVDDRLLLGLGDGADEPATLAGGGESFTFSGFAYVRVTADAVLASGGLQRMTLKVRGTPKLVLNGVEQRARVADGLLTFAP